ncbi:MULTISPECIES: type VI secretion system Vgr family protein [Enterobacter]|jgi:type VI secretion system secreted protein VgrG|uniref:type VI secretion system Vgr family protein n=1 Tax=Enterobacter roggenkampii TaxID=1812935 RepID=UPI001E3BFF58|nr:type VI secretion system Vgr family protein [Enterobacter roggenkampii]MCE1989693.1 type VI secretion system tip protein VgrG [Enterobacter roggenkampii]MCK6708320.1 type VI secretion system tip protein VgrG [Enterobacter roggenkampii]MCK6910525.1 type VI secretion system tip protein VgrG [Enterobacter roggenkampii]MCK7203578.1 type VI secretion system tip protein VgrG [Enterobacter roggenkampii]MDM9076841.1 type VI secretion system tip protein VgrG [Enterobacter roggenkampii]
MSNTPPLRYSHSHHLLAVKGCESALDVLAFEGDEALSTPFRYRIEFTSSDHAIAREAMLMKPGSLTLQAPVDQGYGIKVQQAVRTLQGVVTGFERLSTSKDETRYALTLRPRLALLDRSHQNAIYQDMSVPQIVEKILRERHGMRGQDFLFSLSKEYPRREQVMQYGEDDLHFITRLLGEVGIWFRFTTDTRLNIDVVEFYDSQQGYEKGLTLPSVPPSGQHSKGVDSVWGMECHHNVVQKQVSTRDYNYRQATQDMNTLVDATRGDVTTYGDAYHWADNYLTPGSTYDRNPAPESGAFYARLRHERYLNGQTRAQGITSCPTLSPGQVLKVTGGYEVADVFAQGVVITAMHTYARRDKDFAVDFDGIPDSTDFGFRPEPGSRPVMAGTLPARVTSTTENDTYGHIDKDGRYRVNMLFDRDNWETGFESLWVRQSRPYAGDTYGLHLPLLAGTEVAIGFEDGNPDRPYIAGVLHDSAHGDHVTIRNYKRNVLRTPANNKIRLDDERGKEHIKVSTEYGGKSQLNLGHLVDSEKQQRGEGFELRTDSWGAIRAQKGIFISADGQARAQGQVLEMQAAMSQLEQARSLAEALRSAAEAARAELADVQTQKALLSEALTDLKKAALLVSAPEGIAQVTGKSLQQSAGDNIISTSGGHTDFSALKRFTVAAGERVSLYAQKLGIKMFAGKGKVEIQAQGDEMTLDALKDIRISSSEGKLIISAKQEIILTSGGGYIRIADGTVECAAPDKIIERGAVWQKFGGQSFSQAAQKWESSEFEMGPEVLWPYSETPVAGQKISLTHSDGTVQELMTSASGRGEKQNLMDPALMQINLKDED